MKHTWVVLLVFLVTEPVMASVSSLPRNTRNVSPQISGVPNCGVNHILEGNECIPCPPNAFTLSNNSTQWSNCICRSGFSGNITSSLSTCKECGTNMFGYQGQCVACPAHSSTNGQTAQSMCECDISFFADGNQCVACPSNTTTARVGAQSIGHCVCVQRDHSLVFWNGEMQCRPTPRFSLQRFIKTDGGICNGASCVKFRSLRYVVRFLQILVSGYSALTPYLLHDFQCTKELSNLLIAITVPLLATFDLAQEIAQPAHRSSDSDLGSLITTSMAYLFEVISFWWKIAGHATSGNIVMIRKHTLDRVAVVCEREDCKTDTPIQVCPRNVFLTSTEMCSVRLRGIGFISELREDSEQRRKRLEGEKFPLESWLMTHLNRDGPFWLSSLFSIFIILIITGDIDTTGFETWLNNIFKINWDAWLTYIVMDFERSAPIQINRPKLAFAIIGLLCFLLQLAYTFRSRILWPSVAMALLMTLCGSATVMVWLSPGTINTSVYPALTLLLLTAMTPVISLILDARECSIACQGGVLGVAAAAFGISLALAVVKQTTETVT
eukprot:c6449_g2_i1.p1 GENE.c6449_g2_i1~~c6449_g2_i1.p1  ORF type:complete len:554 (+),score=137.02 c6449_g2_i1:29-1690(+)